MSGLAREWMSLKRTDRCEDNSRLADLRNQPAFFYVGANELAVKTAT